jgi:D-lactate dehydrogenase (cytochrome)
MNSVVNQLSKQFGTRFLQSPSRMAHYCRDESYHTGPAPDGVVFPRSTDEVAAIVRLCSDAGMPIIPYGAGTSLEGHIIVVDRGIVVDFREMNAILSVNASDLDCRCQPGVTREDLNSYLRDTGLYFPIDPGANATLGGMVSTSASGTTAVRYGTVKENVLSLEVVLADGSVIRTGRRARKTAAGYDLTHLFVGSEGTLGLITELCLRLYGIPEVTPSATCTFATLSAAVESVIEIVQLGIPIARIELMDEHQVEACNRFSGVDKSVAPTLLFEFHGSAAETEDHIQRVKSVLEGQGAGDLDWARRPEDRARLWKARHSALAAAKSLRPGCEVLITDVAVPISRLADCITATRNDIDQANLVAPIVGHVGDGNFHVFFVINPNDALEREKVTALSDRLALRAIEMDGTCTGEHGIGLGKKGLLEHELGRGAVDAMRAIKQCLDPKRILNPGKIFDDA